MSKITLTADDETLIGYLPDSWAKVPLAGYAALAAADTLPERVAATAALVGLPAAPLLADVKFYATIVAAAPWLFGGELPEASHAVSYFTHAGTTYHHVGPLDKISAQQLEALLGFLADSEGKPLDCAPGLLAVLYCAAGHEQTREVVAIAQQALATLPMSVAWPALADFMRNSGQRATSILFALAIRAQAENLLTALETAQTMASDSCIFWQRPQRWLIQMWLRNARKTL